MPTVRLLGAGVAPLRSEGKYTQEGGGAVLFEERVESLEELYSVLDVCFADNSKINTEEFQHITENKTSDMVLSVLLLFRERLPCSENYWRYKRNYELHMNYLQNQ